MKYNVFFDNQSVSITHDDKVILSNITLKFNVSRALGVEFSPSEIEREENLIRISFKRKKSFTYGELRHAILELEEVGSSLKVSLNALASRYNFLAHGAADLCFTMPSGTAGALALDSVVPCWMNVSFPGSMTELKESVDSLAFKANGVDVHLLPLCNDKTASRICSDGLKISPRNNGASEINSTVMCITASDDPYKAVHEGFVNMSSVGAISVPLASDRKYPEALEGLGWCTWEAFHHGLTSEKELAKMDEIAALNARIAEMEKNHAEALDALKAEHGKAFEDFTAEKAGEVDALKNEHLKAMEAKDAEMAEKESGFNAQIADLQAQIEASKSAMEAKEAEIKELERAGTQQPQAEAPADNSLEATTKVDGRVCKPGMSAKERREALANQYGRPRC